MLLKIYIKEMKDSFRDRRTLLLTVLLPIVMMTGLTLFYEQMISEGEEKLLTLAVDESTTEAEMAIFTEYENVELLNVADPEKAVQDGEAHAAVLLSTNFSEAVASGQQAAVTIIGDSNSQNSDNLMSMVRAALGTYEKSTIAERLEAQGADPQLVQPFALEQKEIAEESPGIGLLAMLVPLILALSIGVGAGPAAADLFAGEKEKKTMEALLMTPVNRATMLGAKWMTISSIGAITGIITLIVVSLEIAFLTENLKKSISFGDNALLIVGVALLVSVMYAMFVASMLMLTSIIGKTVKEAQSYSTPIMMLAMFPTFIVSTMGVNELAFQHFAIPLLNLFSLLKELLFGVVDFQHVLITLASNLICMIVVFIIGRVLFLKDKWVMN
ncbi:ABC transporter permease [Radiobacillus sp. PE A8.2]|uniref:ABC transporter permease n=1 Tax=Radiobacillus sp. PE A8.2 TaxID=3380349 RepID=UPI00388F145A